MKTYKQLKAELEVILEAKQVGTLYHYTDSNSLKRILNTDRLGFKERAYHPEEPKMPDNVSTTRDKNFHKKERKMGFWGAGQLHVSLELDGDKLSNSHKIKPHQDPENNWKGTNIKKTDQDESEERIKGNIPNIKKYIKKIRIHSDIHPNDLKELQKHNIPIEHVK